MILNILIAFIFGISSGIIIGYIFNKPNNFNILKKYFI